MALDESDEVLVKSVLHARSEAAFRELYRRYTPRLYRLASRMTNTTHDAEDIVQDTWLRATMQLSAFTWRSSLGTWLTSIAINVTREQLRRGGHTLDVSIDEVSLASPEKAETIDLERAVRALPPGSRAVFLLHDVEGLTHDEIGVRLGCTAGTSKTQLHRARRALRARLKLDDSVEAQ
jgi:RNA polymerase sigma-70 factor (ECF subfamily)